MKKRILSVLCTLVLLGGLLTGHTVLNAEEAPTYETQIKDSTGYVYGSSIVTNLYAGCTYGFCVMTPKADIAKMMKITSDEEWKGGEPVMYVGNFSWETKEKRLVDELMDKFGGKLVFLLDLQLFKYDGSSNVAFPTTTTPLQMKVGIPEKARDVPMWVDNREFAMIRIHDGKAELLRDTDTDLKTITFESDKFSVYALVYAPAGNIDTYLVNAGLVPAETDAAADTQTAAPANTSAGKTNNSEYDDVPKTGDIAWEIEYGYY